MAVENMHSKTCKCNQCEKIKPLDEMVSFETEKVKCVDCETEYLSKIKYQNYLFNFDDNSKNETEIEVKVKTKKIKKLMEWCLG